MTACCRFGNNFFLLSARMTGFTFQPVLSEAEGSGQTEDDAKIISDFWEKAMVFRFEKRYYVIL